MANNRNWNTIKAIGGAQHFAFESLCCQLAREEIAPYQEDSLWRFERRGAPDGGIEALWVHPELGQHGWQAKFFPNGIGKSQWAQIDKSVTEALAKHPSLRRYVLCVPFNLPDDRSGRRTARQSWNERVARWNRSRNPQVDFVLWDQGELDSRLMKPERAGMVRWFFDTAVLSEEAVRRHVGDQVAQAGQRYSPSLHVRSELETVLEWLTARPSRLATQKSLLDEFVHAVNDLTDHATNVRSGVSTVNRDETASRLRRAASDLANSWTRVVSAPFRIEHWNGWKQAHGDCKSAIDALGSLMIPEKDYRSEDIESYWLRTAREKLWDTWDEERSRHFEICEHRVLAIIGEAGVGKTHALCECAVARSNQGLPTLISLGFDLDADGDPFSQLAGLAGLPGATADELFGALSAAGQACGERALVILDGLNESEGNLDKWRRHIARLLELVARHPHVAVALSIREEYGRLVYESFRATPYERSIHGLRGFDNPPEAIRQFFSHYHIDLPATPDLDPEFANPLFLMMFCRATAGDPNPQRHGPPVVPSLGGASLSAVFEAFLDRIERDMADSVELDRDVEARPVAAFLRRFASLLLESEGHAVDGEHAKRLAGEVFGITASSGILKRLCSAGVLIKIHRPAERTRGTFSYLLGYERLAGHVVASTVLEVCADAESAKAAIGQISLFVRVLQDPEEFARQRWLMDAFVLQWVERFGVEMLDTVSELMQCHGAPDSMLATAAWRRTGAWTDSTRRYLLQAIGASRDPWRRLIELVVKVGLRPGHPLNARSVHAILMKKSLAVRDSEWTVNVLSQVSADWRIRMLVEWPRRVGFRSSASDEERLLYATLLAWLTAATHLRLRTGAMRAIVCVLDQRVDLCREFYLMFADVNDPYVAESVLSACLGVALRSQTTAGLGELADAIRSRVFGRQSPPRHILIRDCARGIVECAVKAGVRPRTDLKTVEPPYGSAWPADLPSWEVCKRRLEELKIEGQRSVSELIASVTPECGDFARYVLSGIHYRFNRATLGKEWKREPPSAKFGGDHVNRYVVTRVLELGWTPERFEKFDRITRTSDRSRPPIERIGKKYQWIAYHEYCGFCADNVPLSDNWEDSSEYDPRMLAGPWELGQRSPDPTIIHLPLQASPAVPAKPPWWAEVRDNSIHRGESKEEWYLSRDGFPEVPGLLEVQHTRFGGSWATLVGFYDWRSGEPRDGDRLRHPYRNLWIHSIAVVASQPVRNRLRRICRLRGFWNRFAPHPVDLGDRHLRELYQFDAAQDFATNKWCVAEFGHGWTGLPAMRLADRFVNEAEDDSRHSLCKLVPTDWLMCRMGARHAAEPFLFESAAGVPMIHNPSFAESGPDVLLARIDDLDAALVGTNKEIVWLIVGEKLEVDPRLSPSRESSPPPPRLHGIAWRTGGRLYYEEWLEAPTGWKEFDQHMELANDLDSAASAHRFPAMHSKAAARRLKEALERCLSSVSLRKTHGAADVQFYNKKT